MLSSDAVKIAVNWFQQRTAASSTIAGSRFISGFLREPAVGLEPTTCGLRNRCSATELRRRGIVREVAAPRTGPRATRLSILRHRRHRQASATNEGKLTKST